MRADAVQHHPNETGGVLMGRWESKTSVVVQAITGPGPAAEHEKARFNPDHLWQKDTIARLYDRYRRSIDYLGDWHTHPGGSTTPSRKDLATARLIRDRRAARAPRPIMLVIASEADGRFHPVPHILKKRLNRMELLVTQSDAACVF